MTEHLWTPSPTWPQTRADLETRLPADTLSYLDAVIDLAQRWTPQTACYRYALHTVRVLAEAGTTDAGVLAAGAVLDLVRTGSCPIQEIQRQLGSAVTKLLVRLVPIAADQAHAESARQAALRQLPDAPLAVRVLAFADARVRAAELSEHPDYGQAGALIQEIQTYLLPLTSTGPFNQLLNHALADLAPRHDTSWDPSPRAVATRLRQLRHHAQLLPDHVAAAAGLPADLYSRLEAGQADPGDLQVIQVQALAAALGVDVRQLLLDNHPGPSVTAS